MNSVIYEDSYASSLESQYIRGSVKSRILSKSDTVVNPINGALTGKRVIINLPVEVPLEDLIKTNQVISRFPIGFGIDCIPYDSPIHRDKVTSDDISCLILQDFMLMDLDYLDVVKNNKFAVGINELIDSKATLIGMKVLENELDSNEPV